MKSAPREAVSNKPGQKRRHRARPTPRWLKQKAEAPEAVAARRCMLVLSVLSGEQPVTDAINATDVSRQLYYQLEDKALNAMLRALAPASEDDEEVAVTLTAQLEEARAQVKLLEREKRRAERLLALTRKLVRPGPMKLRGPGRPRKPRSSTTPGPKFLPSGPKSPTMSPGVASTPTPTSVPTP